MQNIQQFGAMVKLSFNIIKILYQNIKEKIVDFYQKKDEFLFIRDRLISIIVEKKDKLHPKALERICFSVSILMTTGLCCFWDNCVEDIISFAYSGGLINHENCIITLKILENINKELNEIPINHKVNLRVSIMIQ